MKSSLAIFFQIFLLLVSSIFGMENSVSLGTKLVSGIQKALSDKTVEKEVMTSYLALTKSNLKQNKKAGMYLGPCIDNKFGPKFCSEDRLICNIVNDVEACFIGKFQRCDKTEDHNTTCGDIDFKCINYKVLDSKQKEIALCGPKETYMDMCSNTSPCAKGFECTKVSIGLLNEYRCLVSKNEKCNEMKMCGKGAACEDHVNCKPCSKSFNPAFKTNEDFLKALKNGMTCDELLNAGK